MTTQTAQSKLVRISKTTEQIYGVNVEGTCSDLTQYSQNTRGITAEGTIFRDHEGDIIGEHI